jgi:hypothetical protein
MAFSVISKKSNKPYYLHCRETALNGGKFRRIFFFAGQVKEGALDALPEGYEVFENERTGLPMLRGIKK